MDLILVVEFKCVVHSRWDMSEKTKYAAGTSKEPLRLICLGVFSVTHKGRGITALYNNWQISFTLLHQCSQAQNSMLRSVLCSRASSRKTASPPPSLQQQSFGKSLHLLPCGKQWKLKWDKNQSSHLPRLALHSKAEWVLTKMIELGKVCLSVLLVTVGHSWPVMSLFLILFCIKRLSGNSN